MLLPLPVQERPQHRALGRLVGDVNDSGEPSAMDEGELPVDANGEVVSGDPVDPNDPRVTSQRPAGRSLVSLRGREAALHCLPFSNSGLRGWCGAFGSGLRAVTTDLCADCRILHP